MFGGLCSIICANWVVGGEAFMEEHWFYIYALHIPLDPLGISWAKKIWTLCVIVEMLSMSLHSGRLYFTAILLLFKNKHMSRSDSCICTPWAWMTLMLINEYWIFFAIIVLDRYSLLLLSVEFSKRKLGFINMVVKNIQVLKFLFFAIWHLIEIILVVWNNKIFLYMLAATWKNISFWYHRFQNIIFPLLSVIQVMLITKNWNTANTFENIYRSFYNDDFSGSLVLYRVYMESGI